ncbi:hypothetical protein BV22DRAFT_1052452, partial [Leucogyrophana mollusca]
YQYGDLAAAQKLEKRITKVYPSDPLIKRFAQRHTYLSTDAIAARDLGLAMVKRQLTALGLSDSSGPLEKQDSARPSDGGPPTKCARPISPPPPRDRDRDRWDSPPSRRRIGGPTAWERDRERERERERLPIERERERGDENGPSFPACSRGLLDSSPAQARLMVNLLTLILTLGPIFRADDIMTMFWNAIIPGATRGATPPAAASTSSWPPSRRGPEEGVDVDTGAFGILCVHVAHSRCSLLVCQWFTVINVSSSLYCSPPYRVPVFNLPPTPHAFLSTYPPIPTSPCSETWLASRLPIGCVAIITATTPLKTTPSDTWTVTHPALAITGLAVPQTDQSALLYGDVSLRHLLCTFPPSRFPLAPLEVSNLERVCISRLADVAFWTPTTADELLCDHQFSPTRIIFTCPGLSDWVRRLSLPALVDRVLVLPSCRLRGCDKLSERAGIMVLCGIQVRLSTKAGKVMVQRSNANVSHTIDEDERTEFTNHINGVLENDPDIGSRFPIPTATTQLFDECRDGLIRCQLTNDSVPDTINTRVLNKPTACKPLNVFQITENNNFVITSAKAIGCSVVSIGSKGAFTPGSHLADFAAMVQLPSEALRMAKKLKPNQCFRDPLRTKDLRTRAEQVLQNAANIGYRKYLAPSSLVSGNPRPLDEQEAKDYGAVEDFFAEGEREAHVFTLWLNSLRVEPGVFNLCENIKDSLQCVSKPKGGVQAPPPSMMDGEEEQEDISVTPNQSTLSRFTQLGKQNGMHLFGIQGADVVDGSRTLVLGLVWQLMRPNITKTLMAIPGQDRPISDTDLLKWANSTAQKGKPGVKTIRSFKDPSITLLEALRPGIIDPSLVINVSDSGEDSQQNANLKLAISTARKMNALVFLVPEDNGSRMNTKSAFLLDGRVERDVEYETYVAELFAFAEESFASPPPAITHSSTRSTRASASQSFLAEADSDEDAEGEGVGNVTDDEYMRSPSIQLRKRRRNRSDTPSTSSDNYDTATSSARHSKCPRQSPQPRNFQLLANADSSATSARSLKSIHGLALTALGFNRALVGPPSSRCFANATSPLPLLPKKAVSP